MAVSSSTFSSLGVGSGLDLSTLLDNLKSSERQQLVPLNTTAKSYNLKLSAYSQLTSAVTGLQKSADKLADPSLFRGTTVTATGDAISATSSTDAVTGSYSVSVAALAQSQSLVSAGVADRDASIGQGGSLSIAVGDGDPVSIDLPADASSLADIRDAINKSGAGVSASIINDGSDTPYRLALSADDSGADNQIVISATDSDDADGTPLANLLNYNSPTGPKDAMQETVAARNADLTVNGIHISRPTNSVDDAIQGVSLKLNAVTDKPSEVTTTRDNDSIKGAIKDFVSAFNSYKRHSDQLTAYNGPNAQNNGPLLGDSIARRVGSQLRGVLNTPIANAGDGPSVLGDIGISLQTDGTLKIEDEDGLSDALAKDPRGVAALFAGASPTSGKKQGLGGAVSAAIDALTGDSGLLSNATDGMQKSIDDVKQRIKDANEKIDNTIERYRKQFVQLDTTLSRLNSTQSYLTTQFDQMNKSSK